MCATLVNENTLLQMALFKKKYDLFTCIKNRYLEKNSYKSIKGVCLRKKHTLSLVTYILYNKLDVT